MKTSSTELAALHTARVGARQQASKTPAFDPHYLFLIPSALTLMAVLLFPICYTVYLSFFDHNLNTGSNTFIGFGNYVALLSEGRVWSSLTRTILIAGTAVVIEIVLGLFVAYGFYNLVRGAKTLNLLFFVPQVITPVVAAVFFRWVFIGQFGLIAATLAGYGIEAPDFLGTAFWAPITVIWADVWQFTPLVVLILYSAMLGVDESQLEAARIDGAGAIMLLRRIVVPAIKPFIMFAFLIRMMDAFRYFDSIYVLTAGGPGTATETITMYTYVLAFRLLDSGKASALGVLTLVFLCVVTAMVFAFNRFFSRRSS
jgi:multiple sugar transport system permease protein